MPKKTPTVESAVSSLTNLSVFSSPVEKLTLAEQVSAYATTHFIEEVAKGRREALREKLLDAAEKQGTANEKGGQKLEVEGHTVLRERRVSSSPDEKKLMKLMEEKGLTLDRAFDKVQVLQANPSKVSELVASGHLTAEEAAALYKVTFACVVHASDSLTELLENSVPAGVVPEKKSRR